MSSAVILACEEDLDEEDLLLLTCFRTGTTPGSSDQRQSFRFDFEKLSEEESWTMLRFQKRDVHRLKIALRVPEKIRLQQRSVFSGLDALCVLLRRLAYPNRWFDLVKLFGRTSAELSLVCTFMVEHITETFGHLLLSMDWLTEEDFQQFASAIQAKGSPLNNCWGFIDGTAIQICRPTKYQKEVFSGHKRYHCLKYQSAYAPNGLIVHLFGPMEGKRHDAAMLRESNLLQILHEKMAEFGRSYCLYGDPAYPLSREIMCPYKGARVTLEQEAFNGAMSKCRMSVEWGFGDIARTFAFLDFHKNLKLFLQPVGLLYKVGALLTNCRTCLYSNQTAVYFGVAPPSLERYLN